MFEKVDTNNDGVLNFEEFIEFQALLREAMRVRLDIADLKLLFSEEISDEEKLKRQ